MPRRHERERRDIDEARDPDARVYRHGRRECVVVEAQHTARERLDLLAACAEKAARDERDWALDNIREGYVALYCRGPGWPTVACHTAAQWDEAVARGELTSH